MTESMKRVARGQATFGARVQSKRAAMRPVLSPAACAIVAALAGACTAAAEDVQPPPDQFGYPTGLAVAPDDSVMFVGNANAELQYDSGTLLTIDLAIVDSVAAGWTTSGTIPANCNIDPDHIESLICDETQFIRSGAGVRIGNFMTDIAVQDTGNGTLRLIIPVRGDPSITWVDYDGTNLTCNSAPVEGFAECDDNHRLSAIQNDPDIGLVPPEPFNAFADSAGQFAMVTSLITGDVTLVDSQPGQDAEITDVAQNYFLPDPTTGLIGSTGVAGRTPNVLGDTVYVGARSEDRIQTFTVGRPVNGTLPFLIPGNWFFMDFVGENAGVSEDQRGIKFSADGSRMFEVNRDPPSLQIVDTSLGPDGFPNNRGIAASDICREASELTVLDSGDGDRVYLTCFEDGEMYVVNPEGTSTVEAIETVGRGPYAIAAAPTRNKVFITNFLEDTISVIDTTPGSENRNRVILRIGQPKPASAVESGTTQGSGI